MSIPKELLNKLRHALPSDAFLEQEEDLRAFSYDLFANHRPEAVALPSNAREIAEVLRLCNQYEVPVYPRGAGSGLAGACVPILGGVVLCLSKMNKILEISVTDRLVHVQAGCVTGVLQDAVREQGLFYPPNPTSSPFSTIGGNVAMNAGGASGAKYGVTRDYLLAMTFITPNGEILSLGNKCQKDVVGFDLPRIICGSEGLLGVIADVTLKLIPLPESVRCALAYFPSLADAGEVVTDIVSHRILPCTMELMDATFLTAVRDVYHVSFPEGTGAALLLEVDGDNAVLDGQTDTIFHICRNHRAIDISIAHTEEERDVLWKARRGGTVALAQQDGLLVTLDYVVPISKLPEALQTMERLSKEHGCKVVTIAHAGDGNLHPMVIYDPKNSDQCVAYKKFVDASVQAIISMGGTISGEHGIGLEKAAYLPKQLGKEQYRIIKGIKQLFDPYGIMNPGKLVNA